MHNINKILFSIIDLHYNILPHCAVISTKGSDPVVGKNQLESVQSFRPKGLTPWSWHLGQPLEENIDHFVKDN